MNGVVVSRIHIHNQRTVTQPTLSKITEKKHVTDCSNYVTLSTNVASMSGQCRRWWVNIVSTCDTCWKQDGTALCGIPWWLGRATRLWIGGGSGIDESIWEEWGPSLIRPPPRSPWDKWTRLPGKKLVSLHETFNRCWLHFGTPSATLDQH